jgi:DNA-binding GntR family transcriptional regulator
MFEVITTSRPDFTETLAEVCSTHPQAVEAAARLWAERANQLIRVRIRQVCRSAEKELNGQCGEGS